MAVTIDGTNGITTQGVDSQGTIKLDGNYPVGTSNVALGDTAMDGVSGSYNTAVGDGALSASGAFNFNTAVGFYALNANTGSSNTAMGRGALQANTSGNYNTGIGHQALNVNLTGERNTALGYGALVANTASNNTAVGQGSLGANTTGTGNTAVGYQAGDAITTANENTIVGFTAGTAVTTGTQNCLIGAGAGGQITTGGKNTVIGGYTGNNGGLDIRTVSNNIVLSDGDGNPRVRIDGNGDTVIGGVSAGDLSGTGAKLTIRDASNAGIAFQSGGANTDHWEAYANQAARFYIENNNTSNGAYLQYNSGSGWTSVSDARWKTDWTALENSSSKISALNIGKYHMLNDSKEIVEGAKWDYGVKAQELVDVIPDAVDVPENLDDKYGVVPNIVFWHAVKALQEAMDRIETLEAKVATLEAN